MDTLAENCESAFRKNMEDHVCDFAPRLASSAGPDGVRQFVEQGIEQARHYGFESRDTVRFYLDTACVLGHRFDTDPQYEWAREVLHEPSLYGEDQKADLLSRFLFDYMDSVSGPKNEFATAALAKLETACSIPFEEVQPADVDLMADRMQDMYKEKYDYVGRRSLLSLFATAAESAEAGGSDVKAAMPLTSVLMVAVGHGAFDDPLYPWIGGVFRDPRLTTPVAQYERLYRRSRTWLSHVARHLNEVSIDAEG
jgi:hypothetical protein